MLLVSDLSPIWIWPIWSEADIDVILLYKLININKRHVTVRDE